MPGRGRTRRVLAVVGGMIMGIGSLTSLRAREYIPTGFADLNTETSVDLRLDIPTHDAYTGLVPYLGFLYGVGNLAFGVHLGLGVSIPDAEGLDSQVRILPFVLDFKAKHCGSGAIEICYGLDLELGIDPFEIETDQFGPVLMSLVSHMGRYSRIGAESLGLDPLLVVEVRRNPLFFMAAIGPSLFIPLSHTDSRDIEASLLYEIEGGVSLMDLLGVGLALRGMSTLTAGDNDSLLALDFTVRLLFEQATPVVRFRVPVSDFYSDVMDFGVLLGVNYAF